MAQAGSGAAAGGPGAAPGARRELLAAAAAMAGVSVLVVQFARWGPDWPAQQFRAWLARSSAFLLWNDSWYAGHPLPGYSVLYPLVAHQLGAGGTGVAASVVAACGAHRLLPVGTGVARRRLYTGAVVVTLTVVLVVGQLPFLLGVALGAWAVVAVLRVPGARGWSLAAGLALACSLASPLPGALLLLVASGLIAVLPGRRVAALATAGGGIVVALAVGGAGGRMPCPWSALVGTLVFCAVVWLLRPSAPPAVRAFATRFVPLYAVAAVACWAVPNPVGGNIARLGQLLAVPGGVYLATRGSARRVTATALVLGLALFWTAQPAGGSVFGGSRQPSRDAAYYRGLLGFLATRPDVGRVEIPFTRDHWEASYVAPHYPLARGWERQTDLAQNAVLYEPLSAAAYRGWLQDDAVTLVALPDVPLDAGGQAEAALLRHPPPYLRPVWHDAHWRVWSVSGSRPLATGAGTVTSLGTQEFVLRVTRPGVTEVRIHASRLWTVVEGDACVGATSDGWLTVTATHPQVVVASTELATLFRVRDEEPGCAT
ncbi:hypothetical protein [Cellulomonas alba]|uniref:Integral membrane protein n=1 Tax=Cellulomonas alba TaxID=3053467 RepID=A0ABT7SCC8_9CELL|nr:hypothetical protein [Cellulomonas alba]MDM7853843.1 hypothetical protein [Cellulomonas alba]